MVHQPSAPDVGNGTEIEGDNMERQIVFENAGQKLYGMLHLPDRVDRPPAVALFHGFTGTKIEPHRIFVKMARELMSNGIAAL